MNTSGKDDGLKETVTQRDTLQLPQQDPSLFSFACLLALFHLVFEFFFNLSLFWGEGCKGRGKVQGDGEIRGTEMRDMKSTKGQ